MKILSKAKEIQQYKIFAEENGAFPQGFAEGCSICIYEKGETIIHQSYSPQYFYYIIKGSAQVRNLLVNGKLLGVNILHAPSYIGEMELIDDQAYPLEVIAREEVIACIWDMNQAKEILLEDVAFLRNLALCISRKEHLAITKLAQHRGYGADVRLAQFILDNSIDDVFSIRKVDVADFLGISYRHTEKLFTDLVEEGILIKEKRKYIIRDAAKLGDKIKE